MREDRREHAEGERSEHQHQPQQRVRRIGVDEIGQPPANRLVADGLRRPDPVRVEDLVGPVRPGFAGQRDESDDDGAEETCHDAEHRPPPSQHGQIQDEDQRGQLDARGYARTEPHAATAVSPRPVDAQQVRQDDEQQEDVDLAVPDRRAYRLEQQRDGNQRQRDDAQRPARLSSERAEAQHDHQVQRDENACGPHDSGCLERHQREWDEDDGRDGRVGVVHLAQQFGVVETAAVEYGLAARAVHVEVELIVEQSPERRRIGNDHVLQPQGQHGEQQEPDGHDPTSRDPHHGRTVTRAPFRQDSTSARSFSVAARSTQVATPSMATRRSSVLGKVGASRMLRSYGSCLYG